MYEDIQSRRDDRLYESRRSVGLTVEHRSSATTRTEYYTDKQISELMVRVAELERRVDLLEIVVRTLMKWKKRVDEILTMLQRGLGGAWKRLRAAKAR